MSIEWLKAHPPKKNPYFRMPDVKFLVAEPKLIERSKAGPPNLNIKDIFEKLEKMDKETHAQFLLRLISHSTFEPNFQAMADALNVKHGSDVKRRFKGIAKKLNFQLTESNRILPKTCDKVTGKIIMATSRVADVGKVISREQKQRLCGERLRT